MNETFAKLYIKEFSELCRMEKFNYMLNTEGKNLLIDKMIELFQIASQTIAQQPLSGSPEGSPKYYSPFEDDIEYHDSIGE